MTNSFNSSIICNQRPTKGLYKSSWECVRYVASENMLHFYYKNGNLTRMTYAPINVIN